MRKIGVGEEFPVDDALSAAGPENPQCPHCPDGAHPQGWHEHRADWDRHRGPYPVFGPPHLLMLLAAAALVGFAIFAVQHVIVLAGLIVLAVLFIAHRHGFDRFHFAPDAHPGARPPRDRA